MRIFLIKKKSMVGLKMSQKQEILVKARSEQIFFRPSEGHLVNSIGC
jgi:hypothetical protein